MFVKVKKVVPQDDYILNVTFDNGQAKEYDIKPMFDKCSIFQNLKDINGLYKQVCVDTGGYGVSWNDKIDLSSDELWKNGKDISTICTLK